MDENRQRVIEELLAKGYHLVESSVAHVTHGGPTIEEANAWLREVKRHILVGTLRVKVGSPEDSQAAVR